MHVVPGSKACLMGCTGGIDCIQHYLVCDKFLELVADPRRPSSDEVLVRLGLGGEAAHMGRHSLGS
eukprot:8850793-Pyramimonas_sp.AAC.1